MTVIYPGAKCYIATVETIRTGGVEELPPARRSTPVPHPNQPFDCYRWLRKVVPVVMGAGMVLAGLSLGQSGMASPHVQTDIPLSEVGTDVTWIGTEPLPRDLATGVMRDLAQKLDVPINQLRVAQVSREIWADSCLGLAIADEVCTPGSVEGWQLEVLGDRQSWFYRTNQAGDQIRLYARTTNLPASVSDRLFQIAAQQLQIPTTQLSLIEAEPWTWQTCLSNDPAEQTACLNTNPSGWRAILTNGQQQWIYHANQDGSEVRLNEVASQMNGAIAPAFISVAALAGENESVLFREISNSGIAGQAYQTILLTDGRLMQLLLKPDGTSSPVSIQRVSPRKLQKFVELLQQHEFRDFNGLDYRAPEVAANEIIVTLIASDSTTQYADSVQRALPIQLRRVIRAWKRLSRE